MRSASSRLALSLLVSSLVALAPPVVGTTVAQPHKSGELHLAGRSLTDALLALEDLGLQIIFSSEVVRPEMTVEREPAPGPPLTVLEEILAPHGLKWVAVNGGRVVIVPVSPPPTAITGGGAVRGVVVDREDGSPLAGAVVAAADGSRTTTDDKGEFSLERIAAGSVRLHIESPGYAPQDRRLHLRPGQSVELTVELERRTFALDEIVVTPSRVEIARDQPVTTLALQRQDVQSLPNPSGDVFRAAATLPGTASNDLSAQINIRGGRQDELLVLLDGLELYEPYHLQDYNSALSIVAPQVIDSLELSAGGFSVAYGDRMSGLMDIRTEQPHRPLSGHLGFTPLNLEGSAAGSTLDGRRSWLVAGRQGIVDQAFDLAERPERPRFWDVFAKGALQVSPAQEARLEWIQADDTFTLDNPSELDRSSYRSTYVWAGHQGLIAGRVLVESIAHLGDIDHDRNGHQDEPTVAYDVTDRRAVDVQGLRQDWSLQATPAQSLKWGFVIRRIETDYDYKSELDRSDPLSAIRTRPAQGTTVFDGLFEGHQDAAYVIYRAQPTTDVTLEMGLRYDDNKLVDDEHASPRFNLVYSPRPRDAIRFSLGAFYQSQRPNELPVADGETTFARDERADLVVAGYERTVASGTLLRAEVYHRRIVNPRDRWENLFDPISSFPELEADRVLLAPDSTTAGGIEIFVLHDGDSRLRWRVGYALSEIEDSIAGVVTPRSIDQTHSLLANVNGSFYRKWRFDLSFRLHSGWPTTALSVDPSVVDGEIASEPVLGPLYQERLPLYHRLDARLSREIDLGKGTLTLFFDLLNVYGRRNVRGFELTTGPAAPTGRQQPLQPLYWLRQVPSFGLRWEF